MVVGNHRREGVLKERSMRNLEGYSKGINLGGWLSQCPSYEKEHFDSFILEEDIKKIASWGMDHVRLPVDYDVIETEEGEAKEDGLKHIDDCIEWCRKYKLNIVLDLHKAKGYMFDSEAVPNADQFFEDESLQDRFYETWTRLITRYGKDKDIILYELLNEVVNPAYADKWNEIIDKAIDVIRAIVPDARIMYGGVHNNDVSSVPLLLPPRDENIVFTFHCYDPLCFTHQKAHWVPNSDFELNYPDTIKAYQEKTKVLFGECVGNIANTKLEMIGPDYFREILKPATDTAKKLDVPLYCGEFGVIDQAPLPDSVRWLADFTEVMCENKIGRAYWSYKRMDFGITDEHYAPMADKMVELLTTV